LRETILVKVKPVAPRKLGEAEKTKRCGGYRRQPAPGGALATLVRMWDVTNT
jgi:hypothetical protein